MNSGTVGVAKPLTTLNSPSSDTHAVVTADGETVYFESDRPPSVVTDIWMARRTASGEFGDASRVIELSSPGADSPMWISPDGCVMYLTSTRTPNVGASDIYRAVRGK